MLSIYQLKPRFQQLLQPILEALFYLKITPNQITMASIFQSIWLGILLLFYQKLNIILLIIPLGLLVRMGLNALDGMMARQLQMQSKKGEILNEMGDIISDLALIFPLAFLPKIDPQIIVCFAVLTIINEFSGLLGKAIGGNRRYEGPMGKSDRAFLIGVFCIAIYFFESVLNYGNWIFGIASLLLVLSTYFRLNKMLAEEKERGE